MNESCICSICGRENASEAGWFLVAENGWGDRLKILKWDKAMALQQGLHAACSTGHLEKIVASWLVTGTLRIVQPRIGSEQRSAAISHHLDIVGNRQLGEIAVDRVTLRRAVAENPMALVHLLRTLIHALDRHIVVKAISSGGLQQKAGMEIAGPS